MPLILCWIIGQKDIVVMVEFMLWGSCYHCDVLLLKPWISQYPFFHVMLILVAANLCVLMPITISKTESQSSLNADTVTYHTSNYTE